MCTYQQLRKRCNVILFLLGSSAVNITIENIEIGDAKTSDRDTILVDLYTMRGNLDEAQKHTQDLLDGYEVCWIKIS